MRQLATTAMFVGALLAVGTSSALSASPTLYVAKCSIADPSNLAVKPSSFNAGCAGGSPDYRRLRWSGWATPQATAVGRADMNICDPSCAAGNRVVYPARLTFTRIRTCMAGDRPIRLYTRLRVSVRFPAGNPFGEKPGWRGFRPPDTRCQPIAE